MSARELYCLGQLCAGLVVLNVSMHRSDLFAIRHVRDYDSQNMREILRARGVLGKVGCALRIDLRSTFRKGYCLLSVVFCLPDFSALAVQRSISTLRACRVEGEDGCDDVLDLPLSEFSVHG